MSIHITLLVVEHDGVGPSLIPSTTIDVVNLELIDWFPLESGGQFIIFNGITRVLQKLHLQCYIINEMCAGKRFTFWADTDGETCELLPTDPEAAADPALPPFLNRMDGTRLAAHKTVDARTILR